MMRIAFSFALMLFAGAVPLATQSPPASHGTHILVLEYHLIGDKDTRWGRSRDGFRRDLQLLYARGYRPITVSQLVDRRFDIPTGMSPVVITFDDSSPGQFSYIEQDGTLEVDPNSAVGIWLAFDRSHPDWKNRATFCLLPGAAAGHSFFGDKGIDGQKTEWRLRKVRFLADQGFELCNHTLWHARLDRYNDDVVQEEIARGVLAIDSAVVGYRVRTFALPLGIWPKNRALGHTGRWIDPHTKRAVEYQFDAVLEVTGAMSGTAIDSGFNPLAIPRSQVIGENLAALLDRIEPLRFVWRGTKAGVPK